MTPRIDPPFDAEVWLDGNPNPPASPSPRVCECCSFDDTVIRFEPIIDTHGYATCCSECGTVYNTAGYRDRIRTALWRDAGNEPGRTHSRPS